MVFFAMLAEGCEDEWPPNNAYTPGGYRVWMPMGMSQPDDLVLSWVDIRVSDWIASRSGEYDPSGLSHLAQTTTYWIIDDYHFPSPWSSTGYAAGDINTWSSHPIARVCLYTGSFGQLASDGIGLPVIAHELDHRLAITHD